MKPFLAACGAPAEANSYTYWKMQDDVLLAGRSTNEWDYTFFNSVMDCIRRIQDKLSKVKGGCIIISSLTTLGLTLERAMAGPAGAKMGGGMDQSKWQDFARQLSDIRSELQVDSWHCIWEGHIYKPPNTSQNKDENKPETLQVSGKSGFNFPNNVAEVFSLQREFGQKYQGSKIDKTYFDTRPTMDFMAGGRLSNEKLGPREVDLTVMYHKLGLKTGRWNAPKKAGAVPEE